MQNRSRRAAVADLESILGDLSVMLLDAGAKSLRDRRAWAESEGICRTCGGAGVVEWWDEFPLPAWGCEQPSPCPYCDGKATPRTPAPPLVAPGLNAVRGEAAVGYALVARLEERRPTIGDRVEIDGSYFPTPHEGVWGDLLRVRHKGGDSWATVQTPEGDRIRVRTINLSVSLAEQENAEYAAVRERLLAAKASSESENV